MRREDLMKPDLLSNILLMSSGIVIVAGLLVVVVLAFMYAG
jgi:hypothetical protein